MAGKKEYAVVATISGLTRTQAINLNKDIQKAKFKNAPNSRGTSAVGLISSVGRLLGNGSRQIGSEN